MALHKMLKHYRWLVRTQAGVTVGAKQAKRATDPAGYGVLKRPRGDAKPDAPTLEGRLESAA